MLDTVEPHSADDPITPTKSWIPDPGCLAAFYRLLTDAIRAGAAAGLANEEIADRITEAVADLWPAPLPEGRDPDPALVDHRWSFDPPREPLDPDRWRAEQAAIALARACAGIRMPPARIDALLASLAPELTGWPDPDALLAIVAAAVEEASA